MVVSRFKPLRRFAGFRLDLRAGVFDFRVCRIKGERCVEDFNGQWAFAIWDTNRRELFLSRDRMGVRPIFYTKTSAGSLIDLVRSKRSGMKT